MGRRILQPFIPPPFSPSSFPADRTLGSKKSKEPGTKKPLAPMSGIEKKPDMTFYRLGCQGWYRMYDSESEMVRMVRAGE